MKYDVLYQEWLHARLSEDYSLADSLRDKFERLHGLTIFAVGRMPVEGVTTRRMNAAKWYRKYGSANYAKVYERDQSKFGPIGMHP